MKILLDLFLAFFRIGLFTIGGGYAMLPMLRRETVENYGWISEEELLEHIRPYFTAIAKKAIGIT